MPAPLVSVQSSPALPASADVVVIGGGIIGSFTAYYLAQRGMSVALLEKGRIGAEQSSRNWGWCRQQNRDARELPMATKSLDLWEEFAADSGEETGFSRCGLLYLSDDEAELAQWAKWRDFARTVGVTTQMLNGAEASARGQATGKAWKGGVFSGSDGTADPSKAAPSVARAFMKLGGTVHQECAARGLELAGGRVCGVVTERGTIRTDTAVLSGGAWASSFCRQLGVTFPQATIKSTVLALAPGAEGLPPAFHTKKITVTRRGDGGHTLAVGGRGRLDVTPQSLRFAADFLPMFARRWRSLTPGGLEGMRTGHESLKRWALDQPTPMERMRVLDPTPDRRTIRLARERAIQALPALRDVPVASAWAGYIDTTPDGVPAIGELRQVPGLVLSAGYSGHGFGIGPGAGHLTAQIVAGDRPNYDPSGFAPDRFVKSSKGKVAEF